jgi:hypothetical protein
VKGLPTAAEATQTGRPGVPTLWTPGLCFRVQCELRALDNIFVSLMSPKNATNAAVPSLDTRSPKMLQPRTGGRESSFRLSTVLMPRLGALAGEASASAWSRVEKRQGGSVTCTSSYSAPWSRASREDSLGCGGCRSDSKLVATLLEIGRGEREGERRWHDSVRTSQA